MNRIRLVRRLALALFAVSLSHCGGGKTESSKADVTVKPENPIVIAADTTRNGTKVTGPWTQFYLSMENGASDPITVVAITMKIYSTATLNMQETSADPNTTDAASTDTTTSTCTYTSYGTWNPGDNKSFTQKNGSSFCDIDPTTFRLSGLEKPPDSSMVYRYRVVMKILGWFGTFDEPTDRFEKVVTFYTR